MRAILYESLVEPVTNRRLRPQLSVLLSSCTPIRLLGITGCVLSGTAFPCLSLSRNQIPINNPNLDVNLTRAIMRYEGAPIAEPTTTDPGGEKLNDAGMHPIADEGPGKLGSGPPDVALLLNISQICALTLYFAIDVS